MSRERIESLTALISLAKEGGVLFRSRTDLDSATLVRGRKVIIYRATWSDSRYKALQVVNKDFDLDLDPDTLSPSQVSKKFTKDILGIPTQPKGICKKSRTYSEDKRYWHFLYYKRGRYPITWEFDIKSAYISFLLTSPSPFYYPFCGYKQNPLLRAHLAEMMKHIPKMFRLMLYGFWCSNCITGEKWEPEIRGGSWYPFKIPKVYHAGLFNACHIAMKDLFDTMQTIKESLGDACIRCHTDSFLITPEITRQRLIGSFFPLFERRIKLELRGCGESILYDVNNGYIAGRKALHPYTEAILKKINPPQYFEPRITASSIQQADIEDICRLMMYNNI